MWVAIGAVGGLIFFWGLAYWAEMWPHQVRARRDAERRRSG